MIWREEVDNYINDSDVEMVKNRNECIRIYNYSSYIDLCSWLNLLGLTLTLLLLVVYVFVLSMYLLYVEFEWLLHTLEQYNSLVAL